MAQTSSPASPAAGREWWSIFDPRTRLPMRAALLVGGAAALFTVGLAWLAGLTLQRQLEAQLGRNFETLAFQIGDKIDRALYARLRELQFASRIAPLLSPEATVTERRNVLEQLQLASPDFAWLGLADRGGRLVAATAGIFEDSTAERQEWFLGAQQVPFIGTFREHPELAPLVPETDAETPRRFLPIAVPLQDAQGRLAGVLGGQLHGSWTREIELSVIPGAARQQQKLSVTVYSSPRDVLLDSEASGGSEPPPPPALPDPRHMRGSLHEPTERGATYLTGFSRGRGFREYRGLGWLTVVRQPVDIAFAPVTALRRTVVGAGMLLSFALACGVWWFAHQHTRRLRSIAWAAERIREGDVLSVIPSPRGATELDRLCQAVGELVEELRPKTDPGLVAAPLARPSHSPVERIQRSV